jgi:hypothetical protein
MEDLRKMWRELWWAMAGGNLGEYDILKSLEVMEFWKIYDLWKVKIKMEHEAIKARGKK